ncbi:MAG: hypothetical protein VKJ04_02105 [Vampirovibrionales bacterium]|nr:hypothetical protein [Vampirovibrionales bacterium]
MMITPQTAVKPVPPVRFGFHAAVDIGTSTPGAANCRFALYPTASRNANDQWRPSFASVRESQVVIPSTSNQAIIGGIAAEISSLLAISADQLKKKKDLQLESLTIFTPGQPNKDGIVRKYNNLQDGNGDQIEYLNLADVERKINLPAGFKKRDDFQLGVYNDLSGSAIQALIQYARQYPERFKSGLEVVYMMSGGGLGSGTLAYKNDGNHLSLQEGGSAAAHESDPRYKIKSRMREQTGGSVRSMLEIFSQHFEHLLALPSSDRSSNKAFDIKLNIELLNAPPDEEFEDILNPLMTHLPVSHSNNLRFITDWQYAKKLFISRQLWHHENAFRNLTFKIPWKDAQELWNKPAWEKAAADVIGRYIYVLSELAQDHVASGCNTVFVYGPTLEGVKTFMNRYGSTYFEKDLKDYAHFIENKLSPRKRDIFDKVFMVRMAKMYDPNSLEDDSYELSQNFIDLFYSPDLDIYSDARVENNLAGSLYMRKAARNMGERNDRLLLDTNQMAISNH